EIVEMFGNDYSSRRNYTTHSKGAQEAHEAIRPTYINNHTIEGTAAEKRLYELIWKRTVASQMVPADVNRSTINISVSGKDEKFVASGEVITFDGFLRLYSESHDEEPADQSEAAILPVLEKGTQLIASTITATERFSVPPMRFSEPLLVKRLEELGIGRPSTYAPTISTIITRGYVEKSNKPALKRHYTLLTLKGSNIAEKLASENYGAEKNRLAPTDIGMVVNDYLEQNFGIVMDYNFTAKVEKEFDRIADGEQGWNTMIGEFYGEFHQLVDTAITTQVEKNSQVRILGVDPESGRVVKARIGRFGPMVEIETAEGEKPRFASLKKGQLIEAITLEEALELFALPRTLGKYEEQDVIVGIGKFGAYVRYGNNFASLAKGDDPYTLTFERALELIEAQKKSATAAATPIKTFEEDADLVIKNGRYGAYIAYKGKNYRIPRGKKVEALTYAECVTIVNSTKK
ncbi:MAG: DNA topoisomerase I, partial [Alistipes sp.]|nr:DNA topoisomerase I [Alistipes sp.]